MRFRRIGSRRLWEADRSLIYGLSRHWHLFGSRDECKVAGDLAVATLLYGRAYRRLHFAQNIMSNRLLQSFRGGGRR
jgi:hypothetical protein